MKTKKGREEKKVSVGEEKEKEKKRERNRQERIYREDIRGRFANWAQMALKDQGFTPARHHLRVIEELEGVAAGDWDRLLLLLPPGSAKSTYAVLNVLMGTLGAMATSVVSYWVGSSAGSARKDARLAGLSER